MERTKISRDNKTKKTRFIKIKRKEDIQSYGYRKINWTRAIKNKIPDLKVGDTVKVHQKIKEGNRERIQVFEGIIIKKQNGGVNASFTVRKISYGVGVEKTFLVHSPLVEKLK